MLTEGQPGAGELARFRGVFMTTRIRSALAAAAVTLLAFPAIAEMVKFSGKVVDDKGKVVKDAQVGIIWNFDGKKFVAEQTLTVAKDGTFEDELDIAADKPVVLMAFDKTQKRGGFEILTPAEFDRNLKIEIDNLVSLTGNFDVGNIRGKPETVEMIFAGLAGEQSVPAFRVELPAKKRFNVKVPGGKYILKLGCDGGEREPRELLIPNGKTTHDLKDKLVLSPVSARPAKKVDEDNPRQDKNPNKGKAAKEGSGAPPALNITDASGVPKTMKLSDYKGKWILLEFWGYW